MFKQFKPEYPKFKEVVAQAVEIVAKLNLVQDIVNQPDGQIAIQNNELNVNNHRAGIGKSSAKTPEWEQGFCHLQPEYKDTAIAEYLDWLKVPTYRTRIMLSRPKTCYSIHNDYSPRLHLPLVTNDQCYFLFTNPEKMIHIPADGKTYWVDTREYHTFLNGSISNRLHLVMIVKE